MNGRRARARRRAAANNELTVRIPCDDGIIEAKIPTPPEGDELVECTVPYFAGYPGDDYKAYDRARQAEGLDRWARQLSDPERRQYEAMGNSSGAGSIMLVLAVSPGNRTRMAIQPIGLDETRDGRFIAILPASLVNIAYKIHEDPQL